MISIQENARENTVCKVAVILSFNMMQHNNQRIAYKSTKHYNHSSLYELNISPL